MASFRTYDYMIDLARVDFIFQCAKSDTVFKIWSLI